MQDLETYCQEARRGGASAVKVIDPGSVVTAAWVRLKCQFGCPGYNKGYCCPPFTPTWEQTRSVLDTYERALLFHIRVEHRPQREQIYRHYFAMLVDLEGRLFKDGYYKAFVFLAGPCRLCRTCASLEDKPCNAMNRARPSMEGCSIDVFQTARNNGFAIETLSERTAVHNEFCLMLVD